MLRWMLGNLLVWAVLFFGVPYAGVRFVPPEAGMMFTMALWLAVYPLYIALASHSAAQRKWNTLWLPLVHPALYALGVWLVFHTVPELAYCAGYLAVGYGFWGAGWGMKRRRQRRDGRGRTRIFNREKKRQNSVDVIHAVLFLCGDGDGTAHSGKMILKTGRIVSKYAGSLI